MKNEVMPGYFIEKKGFSGVVNEMIDEGKDVFILDKKGEDIRTIKIPENPSETFAPNIPIKIKNITATIINKETFGKNRFNLSTISN